MIILTGNYNFFNLLTIVLCLSLLDDNFIRGCLGKPKFGEKISNFFYNSSLMKGSCDRELGPLGFCNKKNNF